MEYASDRVNKISSAWSYTADFGRLDAEQTTDAVHSMNGGTALVDLPLAHVQPDRRLVALGVADPRFNPSISSSARPW